MFTSAQTLIRGLPSMVGCLTWVTIGILAGQTTARADLKFLPERVVLAGPESSDQLLVWQQTSAGRSQDVTQTVQYEVLAPQVVRVSAQGMVVPLSEGTTQILVRHATGEARIPVEVLEFTQPQPIAFAQDIVPILTKAGCNAGGCHGKAEGQNGFKLSVFGSNPWADHDSIVAEARGRRLFLTDASQSLFLRKATGELPHGGGRRVDSGDRRYRRLLRWIQEGAQLSSDPAREIVSLQVEPAQFIIESQSRQQLRVIAVDRQGRRMGVTAEAEFDSNAKPIAEVDRQGLIQSTSVAGEAAILVRYLGQVAVCRVTIPRPGVQFSRPPENNFVDKFVWDKLERLGIPPSGLADDSQFLRRVYLDVTGTLPTPAEARQFLADGAPQKRSKLIDRLLDRPEYADYWALLWMDLCRVDKDRVTPQGAVAMARWLRRQFAENRPYDTFVRDLLTVQGHAQDEGAGSFYKVLDTPEVLGRSVSQLFLGTRLECAQCHHHPSERWGQDDYYGFAGFFTGVVRKNLPSGRMAITTTVGTDLKHPRTGDSVPARALGAPPADFANPVDRRQTLADWMTAAENPYFSPAICNRLWAHYFGRGLVEPIDDLRATNPATNEALLAALADHMRSVRFDLKAFTRTLLNSRAYQLSSQPRDDNASDTQNFSHAVHKALPAEVLLDAICDVTQAPEKFNGWPAGYRAIQIWDNRLPLYFFQIFGRPVRATVCECERSNEPSISQALHLMNSPEVMDKIQFRKGRARNLADGNLTPEAIIDELYLAALARFPRDPERAQMLQAFTRDGASRRIAVEDVLWALLNTKEFLYNN